MYLTTYYFRKVQVDQKEERGTAIHKEAIAKREHWVGYAWRGFWGSVESSKAAAELPHSKGGGMAGNGERNTEERDRAVAYGILRLAVGVNLFGHGFVRAVSGVGGFVDWMVQHMSGTIMPVWVVRPFAYFLAVEELVVGALLIVGWFTRPALIVGALVMVALTWGVVMKQDWPTAGLQLSYSIAFFLLLFFRKYNAFSVDGRRKP